ncbi:2Fe-2S iron-sulfur cluster-binding protein [Gordonia terrae]|uniref:2Fe-2S iron-sulfur cluster-binding protein n=1 Tax=Gordonia terrae TaxID=2055 RepID=UPI003F6ACB65
MAKVLFVTPDGGETVAVDAEEGNSLMQAALDNGIAGITAECNGTLACATCHVYVSAVDVERVGPPAADEDDMLEFTESPRTPESRLSCQIIVTSDLDGAVVQLPAEQ